MSQVKIIVAGDVEGGFDTLYRKVGVISAAVGPFEFLLCVGSFFGANNEQWEKYQTGEVSVPVPTYIMGPVRDEHKPFFPDLVNGCQLAPGITYLGQVGLFVSSSNLKVAYVSGLDCRLKNNNTCLFDISHARRLRDICRRNVTAGYKGIDILLTSQWPSEITNLDYTALYRPTTSSRLVGWLSAQLKPRYHFAAFEGISYERQPYEYPESADAKVLTRFIGLPSIHRRRKERWIHALSLKPTSSLAEFEIMHQYSSTEHTYVPYTYLNSCEFTVDVDDGPSVSPFFEITKRKKSQSSGQKRHKPARQEECWFCLSNEKVNKHLVVSVGSHTYLALAKGGLVPDHLVISTIAHCQSMHQASEESRKEVQNFKDAICRYFKDDEKSVVFFERNYKSSHVLIQAVPVPSTVNSTIKTSFTELAEKYSLDLQELSPGLVKAYLTVDPDISYFHAELPDGSQIFYEITKPFPLQFGREALAAEKVLNMPDRADWSVCTVSAEEEEEITKSFRSKFLPYDFTISD